MQNIMLFLIVSLFGAIVYGHNANVGFAAPSVYGTANAYSPERGAIIFDTLNSVFLANSGSPSSPNWLTLQYPHIYASGSFDSSYGWSMSNTDGNFHDFSNTAIGTFSVVNSSGITVTEPSGHLVGITFTPASTIATYRVTFKGLQCSGGFGAGLRLYDSTDTIQVDETSTYSAAGNNSKSGVLSGLYTPGTSSSITITIQAAKSATLNCGGNYAGNDLVTWDIQQIK